MVDAANPKYPDIEVELVGQDGNAFGILGSCSRAARRGKVPKDEIDAFLKEATDGDYDHLLRVCMNWFNCS